LNVIKKLETGYHEIDFLMACVNIYDVVKIEISESDEVVSNYNIDMFDNIAYKAWILLKTEYKINSFLKISIDKKIPVSAGMAGGSSDAAAVIRGVNDLFNLNLTVEEMINLGSKIGSDVAFCIVSSLSRAQSMGEIITPINKKLKKDYLVVINPGVGLSTKSVYQAHVISNNHQKVESVILDIDNYQNYLHNDLQDTAIKLEPKIAEIFKNLESFEVNSIVSGSGPTVLAFCDDKFKAKAVYDEMTKKYSNVYLARILR
jgi:4-diphosphocytidyl-2-C-methyl-D-erythritol kinase